jgi:ornithine cyclodeaminase/alanine dehydrogenase-like protein (mu-crystallin family)
MSFQTITFDQAEPRLDWLALTEALKAGHARPRGEVQDVVMHRGGDVMLSRHAWIDGLGAAVKTCMIYPDNPTKRDLPSINGIVTLYDDQTGLMTAAVDFRLVTKWKTAGDSLLAARLLARPDSRKILILGAGTVARSLVEAYSAAFPDGRFTIWNRTADKAAALAASFPDREIAVATDLPAAIGQADIVTSATMTKTPVLKGEWLRPGQHVDLIGAYLPEMREADDTAMRRARVFVDSRDTTLHHIGELIDPLKSGAITEADVIADYYDIASGAFARRSDDEITLFKNGGGAHLDLMTALYIKEAVA